MTRRRRTWKQKFLGMLVLPFLLPLALIAVPLMILYHYSLYLIVWATWLPRGKDVLFVSTNNPNKSEYMTANILPHVEHRAVRLNWSERDQWKRWSLPVVVFYHFAGWRNHAPIVLIFRRFKPVERLRFFPAFRASKKGDQAPLEKLQRDLLAAL